jgi:hypothetical protein
MAVCTADFAFTDFLFNGFPAVGTANKQCHSTDLKVTVNVIKVKDNQIVFAAVHTRMLKQILEKFFVILCPNVLVALASLFLVIAFIILIVIAKPGSTALSTIRPARAGLWILDVKLFDGLLKLTRTSAAFSH